MKNGIILAGTLLSITLVLKASAQQGGGSWSGTDPRQIQFKQVDTSKAIRPSAASRAFHSPSPISNPGINRFFPKLSLGSWPPNRANVSVLNPKQNNFQPILPKGKNPFGEIKK